MAAQINQKQTIITCLITGIYDVNRSNTLPHNDFSLVKDWADSIRNLGLKGILFHNGFSEDTCLEYQNDHLSFVKIIYDATFNPNVYRYLVYDEFLRQDSSQIEAIFATDVSDVVLVQNPFVDPLFINNPSTLFCGDEPKILQNEWMIAHADHLRSRIDNYAEYEEKFKHATLLNCGIFGGNIGLIQPFIHQLANIHRQYNHDNRTAYTGDMGAFNYLARTQYNDLLFHGPPVNTIFKEYEYNRTDCWFRHK